MRTSRLLHVLLLAAATTCLACGAAATAHHPASSVASSSPAQTATPAGKAAQTPLPVGEKLFLRMPGNPSGRIAVLNAAGGAVERELPDGVPSPDWSTLYTIEPGGGTPAQTVIRAVDVAGGAPLRQQTIDGAYALPAAELDGTPGGLSSNGRWLALVDASADGYAAGRSQFVVLDSTFVMPPKRVSLDGIFWFDALSNDGASLYLIERSGPDGSLDYRVRRFDLAAGALDPTIVAEKGGPEQMRGLRITAVAAPDGDRLYSLYTNGPDGAFVHALTLSGRFAICIDLPNPSTPTPAAGSLAQEDRRLAWSLALSAGGTMLYAVNSASGQVVAVDLNNNAVRRAVTLSARPKRPGGPLQALWQWLAPAPAAAKQIMHGGAALSPDGQTLFAATNDGVLAIDTVTLQPRAHLLGGQAIAGLRLSPDGARLYALPADGSAVVVVDTARGSLLGRLQTSTQPDRIWQVR